MNYVWLTVLAVACFGGIVWIGWTIVDLIRYARVSDDYLREKTFPKPRITRLAQQNPSKCRALFIRFDLVCLIVSIAITVGTGWGLLKVLQKL